MDFVSRYLRNIGKREAVSASKFSDFATASLIKIWKRLKAFDCKCIAVGITLLVLFIHFFLNILVGLSLP